MERTAWSDERLDDLSGRLDAGFDRVDRDIRDLRSEMGLTRVDLGAQIDALRSTVMRVGGGIMVGLVGVVAAVLARGA